MRIRRSEQDVQRSIDHPTNLSTAYALTASQADLLAAVADPLGSVKFDLCPTFQAEIDSE